MSKIKIAHCMCGLDGGVGNVVLNYFDHMPSEDYEVHILSNDVSSELYRKRYEERGYKIIQIPRIGVRPFKSLNTMKNIMIENNYDVVHCHMTLTNIFPLWSAKRVGIKTRISHSHLVIRYGQSIKDNFLLFINHRFIKFLATDLMACGTDAGKCAFKNNKFIVLNNAIELSMYEYSESVRISEREKLGIHKNDFVIGTVGRFTYQKNPFFLINAFNNLLKKMPNSKLLLIGEGDLFEQIKQQSKELGIEEKVIFTGAVKDVNNKLCAMDVFTLPSFNEGLPVVALEAQATGLPCIISENVTREVAVSPQVAYLPISQSDDVEKWAAQMMQYRNVLRTKDAIPLLRKCGYDIVIEAKKLDQFYKERAIK